MATRKASTSIAVARGKTVPQSGALAASRRRRLQRLAIAVVVVGALGGLWAVFHQATAAQTSPRAYQVGQPGVGSTAPGFDLAASTGGQVSLAGYRGRTVLLYFQEGLTCQPCWDQLTALEQQSADVKAAGIAAIVSITTDPADLIARKTRDMGLTTPVLSDPTSAVSKAYHANDYGMMGTSRDGHTFILVGPDGVIRWRADYGGAPKYTMFVRPTQLLADLRSGETNQS